ncbi:hypothetical protein [Desmospora profundinema]|uniref:Galactose oxidase-like Early set domain-containing protein n=1 Tax=Desmospora profundinema TaxID=1571184 RepID=A0ABU1IIU9_9BACL|nr:hypothetical protein [Desmospora profundinema]MDR6224678.1 hypothetical protein [Desmospora profundinema]
MKCSGRNLLKNGNFHFHVAPWRGSGIRLVPNPVKKGDTSLAMGNNSVVYQNIQTNMERGCPYYLLFRIFNNRASATPPQLLVTVSYLDGQRRLLQSTPVLVEPPYPATPQFTSFFTIVPPPSFATRTISVVFSLRRGSVLIDYVSIAARKA